jgi:hypothetical protein
MKGPRTAATTSERGRHSVGDERGGGRAGTEGYAVPANPGPQLVAEDSSREDAPVG